MAAGGSANLTTIEIEQSVYAVSSRWIAQTIPLPVSPPGCPKVLSLCDLCAGRGQPILPLPPCLTSRTSPGASFASSCSVESICRDPAPEAKCVTRGPRPGFRGCASARQPAQWVKSLIIPLAAEPDPLLQAPPVTGAGGSCVSRWCATTAPTETRKYLVRLARLAAQHLTPLPLLLFVSLFVLVCLACLYRHAVTCNVSR